MGKKSKGTQVQESANEKAMADIAGQKWDRYKSLYRGVETKFQEEVGKDTSALLRGRATGDVSQAAGNSAGQAIALGRGGVGNLGTTAENIGGARALGAVAANKAAQGIKDKGQLGALAIGLDHSADSQNGMAMAARASATEAMGKARAQQTKNDSLTKSLGQFAGAVGSSSTEGTGMFTSDAKRIETKKKWGDAIGRWTA